MLARNRPVPYMLNLLKMIKNFQNSTISVKISILITFSRKQLFSYQILSKQQYRSEMGIMGDILDVTADGGRDGIIVSAISRKANLSHYAVLDKCEKLVEAGLVESVKNDRNRVYLITEKGLQFFQEFKKFQGLVESMKLRY
jgi:predicted transcriptional regulator